MYKASYINSMENLKTSKQVADETGLSLERVCQFAKRFNVPKFGWGYVWDEKQIQLLLSRVGQRGRKLNK